MTQSAPMKRLREDAASERVLILLTDGANTSGEVQPIQATEFAAREGLRIYTVGVGADEMMVQDFFGSRLVNPSADLDEDTLMAIAERTGGAYFRARDAEALARIYEQLDELEPVESDQEAIRPVDELFFWPLAAAFLLALVGLSGCAATKNLFGFGDEEAPPPSAEPAGQVVDPEVERREIVQPKIDTEDFEVGVFAGGMSVEDFGVSPVYGITLAYHVSEALFVEAAGKVNCASRWRTSALMRSEKASTSASTARNGSSSRSCGMAW